MKDYAPSFDFYPERWLVGIAALSDAEQLSYLRLLCHQWVMDGLPIDLPALKRLAGKGVTPALLEKFPISSDGKRRNARLEQVREKQRSRLDAAKDKSQRMHKARYKHRSEPAISSAYSSACSSAYSSPQALLESCPPLSPVPCPPVPLEKVPKGGEGSSETMKVRISESDKQAQAMVDEASAVPIPASISSLEPFVHFEPFRQAWAEWCAYRSERATTGLKSTRLPWTHRAARNQLLEIERIAAGTGLEAITSRIREAIAGHWQGPNFERMNARQNPRFSQPTTNHGQPAHTHDTL